MYGYRCTSAGTELTLETFNSRLPTARHGERLHEACTGGCGGGVMMFHKDRVVAGRRPTLSSLLTLGCIAMNSQQRGQIA